MGGVLGEQQGVAPGRDYDDELLFLGCLLHDVGLGDHGSGDQPFDIDGADLAACWLRDQGVATWRELMEGAGWGDYDGYWPTVTPARSVSS